MSREPRITVYLPANIDRENAIDFRHAIARLAKEHQLAVLVEEDDFPTDGGDAFSRISENGRQFPTATNN